MIRVEMNQSRLRGGQRLPKSVLDKTLRHVSKALGGVNGVVSVAFISSTEMRKLNRTCRRKDKITDVLSFELDEGTLKGEVLISYEQAKRQAKEARHSTRDEIVFLLVHGILHVFGYDHIKPSDKKKMFRLQERILDSLGIDASL